MSEFVDFCKVLFAGFTREDLRGDYWTIRACPLCWSMRIHVIDNGRIGSQHAFSVKCFKCERETVIYDQL